jgi:hypothetical protein
MLERLREAGYDVRALHHAAAILKHDMPQAIAELEDVLVGLQIPVAELVTVAAAKPHPHSARDDD